MKTSIVGIGQTEFSTNSGRSELRLALEAIVAAMADAGLEINDIDGLVRYTWDNTSEAAIVNALGLPSLKYYGETEFGGVNCCGAVAQASAAIEAGLASCVVFYRSLNARSGVRFGRGERVLSEEGGHLVSRQPEPPGDIYSAPFGLLVPGQHHALYAQSYMGRYGLDEEAVTQMLGSVAVTQRAYANRNTRALLKDRTLSMDDYRAGRVISAPLRVFDYCLETDGAMAIVIVSRERARAMRAKAVDVLAAGQFIRPGSVPMYLYAPATWSLAPEQVGQELFGKAGLSASDIDVAMIYDATSVMVPIALEDFGFIGRGEAPAFLGSNQHGPGGQLPVNTHGGLLSEGYFHGLNTIAEAVRQLRGESANQVAGAKTAFVTLRGASSMVLGQA
jgi:acetyl-CoA acetyltransferase